MMFNKILKKASITLLAASLLIGGQFGGNRAVFAAEGDFSDMPASHWAYSYVNQLRDLNITNGIGDNLFGTGQTVTRAEFVTFLSNLLQWDVNGQAGGSFVDNQDSGAWYFGSVEAAVDYGAILNETDYFRPLEPITRVEMAVMLVRALGYDKLAGRLEYLGSPFSDVTEDTGYITIAKDFGIISGMGGGLFMPDATATREQAATMMVRMLEGINREIGYKNAFYMNGAGEQLAQAGAFDTISFNWGRFFQTATNTSKDAFTFHVVFVDNGAEQYYFFAEDYQVAEGQERMLMVNIGDLYQRTVFKGSPSEEAPYLTFESFLSGAPKALAEATLKVDGHRDGANFSFDGIVVDIEGLKGEAERENFNIFLTSLRAELDQYGKKMFVAVHPKRREGQAYYDGYDYKTIGQLADKVILMAHDYNAKELTPEEMAQGIVMTPLAPIDEVYYALRAITDPESGVEDKSKIVLQLNFAIAQWKLVDGKVINEKPYTPAYEALFQRIEKSGVEFKYDDVSESPYITFHDSEDGTDNVLWYEDERSIAAKIELAEYFGVTGISVWRLGNVPDYAEEEYLDVLSMLSE